RALARWRTVFPTALRVLEMFAWVALAVFAQTLPKEPLAPLDVPLFYAGAVLALTLRGRFKATACAVFGFPPRRTQLVSALGLLHVVPDHSIVVLLDRRPRFLAHLAAVVGGLCALFISSPRPGVWAGAFVVVLIDLCPFIQSSMSGML